MDYGPVVPDMEVTSCPRRMAANDGRVYVVKMYGGDSLKSRFKSMSELGLRRRRGCPWPSLP